MARKLRIQYEGAIYHVTARGVEKRPIFDDERDCGHFLERLQDGVAEYGVRLYLFCLMKNHFHLLVETPKMNLSAFMHKIQTAHTVYYNIRHERSGHLLQGRYSAKLVQDDKYLNKLSRYIHLNPICVDTVMRKPIKEKIAFLRGYRWSSYMGYAGLANSWPFVDEKPLLDVMSSNQDKEKRHNYRRYVEAGVEESDDDFKDVLEKAVWGIGDDEFNAKIRDMHVEIAMRARRPEDVALRKKEFNIASKDVIKVVAEELGINRECLFQKQYGHVERAVAGKMLIRFSGMNQRDVGILLKIGTGAAVCQQLKKLYAVVESDGNLANRMRKMEKLLSEKAGE